MGTLRDDNGGGELPQEGGGLPDLPPEWGTIIIPDDAAALDGEGATIRRQFRRATIRRRWRRRFHLPPEPARRATDDSPGLAVPLLIMSIAVIATLVSLLAVAWPGRAPKTSPRVGSNPSAAAAISLTAVSLQDGDGKPVGIVEVTPAVVLLVDGCSCEELIRSTADAVVALKSRARVVVVAARPPTLPSGLNADAVVRSLGDPNGSLRASVPTLAGDRTTAAVLVNDRGRLVKAVRSVTGPDDFRTEISSL
ncbi:hypothetical protein Dvina_01265 [Dactylosporangium vinaceum]|uniref:Uncharacterized protein n=1 Tax=Dactylosporangium vinaceum TaxID=53362 RepID=A0ABV5MLQ1_9ACTN|nr:hypothetical protein [Dactylosporangium vinaceum]UAB96888.1 hypothetical protein Dvina_01265 [Dactylosporangium vinaceum]